jgi:hypothetical protein
MARLSRDSQLLELCAPQDRLSESITSYSLPAHLYMLAARSGGYIGSGQAYPESFAFPEITQLPGSGKIDWRYYVNRGKTAGAAAVEGERLKMAMEFGR